MKNWALLVLVVIICFSMTSKMSFGQKPDTSVPQEILAELTSKELSLGGSLKMEYKVVYPSNYDSTKAYPMMFGLSGGDQSEDIVNYCYYASG